MKNYFPFSKIAMNLKFDARFNYISRILQFQIEDYLEMSNNIELMFLKADAQFILQRLVVKFDSYIDLILN